MIREILSEIIAPVDDGLPNDAMRMLVEVRAAISKLRNVSETEGKA